MLDKLQKQVQTAVGATFAIYFRAGKIRFSGTQESVLLKAMSGKHSEHQNVVLLVTLGVTRVCLIVYHTMHQMK